VYFISFFLIDKVRGCGIFAGKWVEAWGGIGSKMVEKIAKIGSQ
jgi:hypothetical protein